jgi:hypothetical protein
MRRTMSVLGAGLLLLFSAGSAAAQAWDTPSFFSPRPGEDIGVYLIDPEGPGDVGFAAIWRQEGNLNLGVRGGYTNEHFSLGAEFYGPLGILGPQSPLLVSWMLGLGATFNDVTWLRVPLGASVGLNLNAGSLNIIPYVHPRVAFDLYAFDTPAGEETETEFNFIVDLGADVNLGERFVLRVGASFGEWDALGVGIAYRTGRRLIVR